MIKGRAYSAGFSAVAITAAQDLFEIQAPTDAVVVILGIKINQTTDVKDAEEEILRIEQVRGVGSTTTGSGGSTATSQPVEDGDVAFGGTVKVNNTTRMVAGSGTLETTGLGQGWNVRIPYDYVFPEKEQPVISPGNRWTCAVAAAPGDSLTVSGEVTFVEVGG
jgi:hypothetical protein